MSRFKQPNFWLPKLLLINGVSATLGGLYLISSAQDAMPLAWLNDTGFNNYYFPGVILFAVVGGSAVLALLARIKKLEYANLLAILSGLIMVYWIIGEIASIKHLNILQLIFLASGISVIVLAPRSQT